jgi:CRP/FNR family transcriptional regulator, cyclic AMP receptor protein
MLGPADLAAFRPLHRLGPDQLAAIARYAEAVELEAGDRLFEAGQPAEGCWLIRHGQVVLETMVPGRGRVVVQTLGPGDVLGWSSWFAAPHHWQLAAVVGRRLDAVRLDTQAVQALATHDPAIGYPLTLGLFEALMARLDATRLRLLDLYGSPRDQ